MPILFVIEYFCSNRKVVTSSVSFLYVSVPLMYSGEMSYNTGIHTHWTGIPQCWFSKFHLTSSREQGEVHLQVL